MIEQALKQVLEFFSSTEFTSIVTSLAAIFAIIYPLIRPFLKAKTEARIQHAITQAKLIADNYNELKEKYLEQARQADKLIEELKTQREAMRIAFDQSNLRFDVKEKVTALLSNTKSVSVENEKIEINHNPVQKAVIEVEEKQVKESDDLW